MLEENCPVYNGLKIQQESGWEELEEADQGIGSNIILGFDKSKANEVLEIEERFRPELLITVGYTDEKLEPSYRLPVDEIIEKR